MTELALDVIVYGGSIAAVILGFTLLTSDLVVWLRRIL